MNTQQQQQPITYSPAPNHTDFLKPEGTLQIIILDKNGNVKEERNLNNLVVTVGKNFIAQCLHDSPGPTRIGHMAIGTGSVAPAVANTALGAQNARVALSSSSVAGNVVMYSATFSPGTGTGVLREAGLFNAATSGTMLCRTTFPIVTKEADDTITINWNVTIS